MRVSEATASLFMRRSWPTIVLHAVCSALTNGNGDAAWQSTAVRELQRHVDFRCQPGHRDGAGGRARHLRVSWHHEHLARRYIGAQLSLFQAPTARLDPESA